MINYNYLLWIWYLFFLSHIRLSSCRQESVWTSPKLSAFFIGQHSVSLSQQRSRSQDFVPPWKHALKMRTGDESCLNTLYLPASYNKLVSDIIIRTKPPIFCVLLACAHLVAEVGKCTFLSVPHFFHLRVTINIRRKINMLENPRACCWNRTGMIHGP